MPISWLKRLTGASSASSNGITELVEQAVAADTSTQTGSGAASGTNAQARPWPLELRVSKDRRTLTVTYDDGAAFALPAEYLRVSSPSAEVQGHSPAQRKTVPGKINVAIMQIEPLGNYAAKIVFDDMHSTGIYGWDYLRDLGQNQETRWQTYLDELAAKGLSREQPARPV
jgi:DUF971 family protein